MRTVGLKEAKRRSTDESAREMLRGHPFLVWEPRRDSTSTESKGTSRMSARKDSSIWCQSSRHSMKCTVFLMSLLLWAVKEEENRGPRSLSNVNMGPAMRFWMRVAHGAGTESL
jgi:hypothetical protein